MKHLRLAFVVLASALGLARAQEEEKRGAPPTEIPDFSNLDEYVYEPKSTVTLGFRRISGAKTSFSGQGKIGSSNNPGAVTGANLDRAYHDGTVRPDARTAARLDNSGNPIIDAESGGSVFDPIAPDGKTNTWSYQDARQVAENGFLAFHTYSADVIDTAVRQTDAAGSLGMDLAVLRDMGKLLGPRVTWQLSAGMSVNDISATMADSVRARLTTLSDFYSLFGQTPPAAPYGSPSTTVGNLLDAGGNPVIGEDGAIRTVTTDASVLLGNEPAGRTTSETTDSTSVSNRWKVKGAYFTFHAGPTVWLSISSRLRASVSIGAALVYSGTSYAVTQTFQPETGAEISDTSTSAAYKLLPGYYADATVQFDLTERTGFYAGAVFQSAGSYTQNLDSASAQYSTKIDLSKQNGLRAGLSIRF
ncbi:MAG: hypothetical protein HY736_01770 [Verrucomicrobia bacterium]|nr:hypothetical protein [Verrucomicrobiota bacterium]